jgi:hypothetical protein
MPSAAVWFGLLLMVAASSGLGFFLAANFLSALAAPTTGNVI